MAFQEKQLGQLRPANTTSASLYSPGASTTGIVKNIVVCCLGSSPKFRIFIDDDGVTYDEDTALFWDVPIASGTTIQIDMHAGLNNSAGNLAVRTDMANMLTFTAYGVEVT